MDVVDKASDKLHDRARQEQHDGAGQQQMAAVPAVTTTSNTMPHTIKPVSTYGIKHPKSD